jgi:broad specificity phosphatase PhoE
MVNQSKGFSEVNKNDGTTSEQQKQVNSHKKLWLVRHAQGFHNVYIDKGVEQDDQKIIDQGVELLDPALTKLGREQAQECSKQNILKIPLYGDKIERIELIVISPLLRTIQTGEILLRSFLKNNPEVPIVLHPDVQETGSVPCDTGSNLKKVREFASNLGANVDFSLITNTSHEKKGRYEDTWPTLQERLNDFVQWLEQRNESRILIVSHHGVLLHLTGNPFFNCECRSYELVSKVFVPLWPKLSTCDEELTEADKNYLKIFEAGLRERMKINYGIDLPRRLR